MPLSGIEIYKFLPKTNCKKCGFPTCLAFAMRVAQQTVDIAACPDLSAEGRQALEAAGRPPIQLVTIGKNERHIEVGNETVLYRHEKTFYHSPGLMLRLTDTTPDDELNRKIAEVDSYKVDRVGRVLALDGFALDNRSGNAETFAHCVDLALKQTQAPLVLIASQPKAMEAALALAAPRKPLIYSANKENWEAMSELSIKHTCPLAVAEDGLTPLAQMVDQVSQKGVKEIVIDPGSRDFGSSLNLLTQLRRLALKKRLLGYPIITFPGAGDKDEDEEAMLAAQHIAKYAGIIVLEHFTPAQVYPLLTLRMNIYTDPQKPIQVQPGIYPIGSPNANSPLCATTNFSLTYFSIAGELEASGFPAWLLVNDTEGLSVLTSWAAGKFDGARIAKTVKDFKVADSLSHRSIILPGHVAVLRGEVEEELQGWRVLVGPREAVDIGSFLKQQWKG